LVISGEKIPLFSRGHFCLFSHFRNFYSSQLRNINNLQVQKFGFVFFSIPASFHSLAPEGRHFLLSRLRIFRKTLSLPPRFPGFLSTQAPSPWRLDSYHSQRRLLCYRPPQPQARPSISPHCGDPQSALDKPFPATYKPPSASPRARNAQVAQLVEHATENRSVGGSIPPLGTTPFFLLATKFRKINHLSLIKGATSPLYA
jgi:hypothetical protein